MADGDVILVSDVSTCGADVLGRGLDVPFREQLPLVGVRLDLPWRRFSRGKKARERCVGG